jgi:Tripartite tricarboxylate transporter TctB family
MSHSTRSFIAAPARDYIGGTLMALIGFGATIESRRYDIGSLDSMGPGYFPMLLGVLLLGVGCAIVVKARLSGIEPRLLRAKIDWRGWSCILASIVAFALFGKYCGLVPAIFSIVFISALGDRRNSLLSALLLSLAMVVFGVVVFSWALNIQFRLFGGI